MEGRREDSRVQWREGGGREGEREGGREEGKEGDRTGDPKGQEREREREREMRWAWMGSLMRVGSLIKYGGPAGPPH